MDKEKRLSIDDNFETSPETEDMEVNAVPSDNENPVDESDVLLLLLRKIMKE